VTLDVDAVADVANDRLWMGRGVAGAPTRRGVFEAALA
jgi:O-acetyl-ADP-ribose deacetylase (regulator of RNase III)